MVNDSMLISLNLSIRLKLYNQQIITNDGFSYLSHFQPRMQSYQNSIFILTLTALFCKAEGYLLNVLD